MLITTAVWDIHTVPLETRTINRQPRGIAVREVLTNLAHSALVREYVSAIKECLGPLDLGFQTPDGSALPPVLIQARLECAKRHGNHYVVIKLDLINAYGNSSRAAIWPFSKSACRA